MPLIGSIMRGQLLEYTLTNGIVFALAVYLIVFLQKDTYQSSWALIAIALTYIPFLIFNGFFTNIPIVSYSIDAITGVRLFKFPLGIPFEDFFYSYSLITLTLFFYLIFRKFSIGEKKKNE
jgi:lycopene cyclase domain-containing protein